MIKKYQKTWMSLSIIVTMMTSLAFGTGINARAAEIDENIVFEQH